MNKINKILWGFVILAMILGIYNIINRGYNYKNCAGSMSCNILEDKLNISYKITDKIDLYGLFIMPSGLIIGIILSIKEIKLLEK